MIFEYTIVIAKTHLISIESDVEPSWSDLTKKIRSEDRAGHGSLDIDRARIVAEERRAKS